MKSSAFAGILLTLLMLLLVLTAAFIFLFQGRRTLEARSQSLASDLQRVEDERDAIVGTRAAMVAALTTVESDSVLLEGQLVESQQEVDALTTELQQTGDTLAQLEQDRLDMLARPPQIDVVSPEEGVVLLAGTPVEIVVAAADPVGITDMTVTIDGRLLSNYVVNGLPLLTVTENWTPTAGGSYVIEVEASNGRTGTIVTRTIAVSAPTSQSSTIAIDPNGSLRADIESNVSGIRGLRPLYSTPTTIVTTDELIARIGSQPVWQTDNLPAILAAFDFVGDSLNTIDAVSKLPQTSYYDAVANEMLVAGDVGAWSALDELAYVQQYMRLLQDQHFNLDALNDDLLDYDARLALSALSLGESGYVQNLYLRTDFFTDAERNLIFENLNNTAAADSPSIFADEQTFREVTGLEYVQSLFTISEFGAVAAAWRSPPVSSEQVLHPQKYLDGEAPDPITLPSLDEVLGNGWTQLVDDTFGELWLHSYLLQQLNDAQVETAITGWGGGRFVVYEHNSGDRLAMVLWLTWDTPEDSVEFAALYPNYPTKLFDTVGALQPDGSECWQGGDAICLYQRDEVTFIVRAPDLETAVSIAELIESK